MPPTVEQLEAEFAPKSLHRGNILVLSPRDALELIERARTEGFPVLGLDGFHLDGKSIQPDMGLSIDYSTHGNDVANSWAAAATFIQEHASSVNGFEVVLGRTRVPAA